MLRTTQETCAVHLSPPQMVNEHVFNTSCVTLIYKFRRTIIHLLYLPNILSCCTPNSGCHFDSHCWPQLSCREKISQCVTFVAVAPNLMHFWCIVTLYGCNVKTTGFNKQLYNKPINPCNSWHNEFEKHAVLVIAIVRLSAARCKCVIWPYLPEPLLHIVGGKGK